MYRLNENDPNSYIPTEVYEDSSFEDYQFSSNSMVRNGYYFERGPHIYSVEAAGTTYYYQTAVPVPRYEDSSYVDYRNSSNSMVPNSCHFERGQYIYTVEAGGTTYYYQNAVAVYRISGVPQSSNSYDVTHTLLSTSPYIVDNGNIDILMSNETVKKSEESNSSVKSDAICDVEENEKVIYSVEHEVYIISDETSDIETNTKVKQEDKKVKPEVKHSLKNEECVRNGNVFESEKELNLSPGKVDKVCNVEENKKMKRKVKKRKAKAIKPIEKKNSADKDEVCISQLIKKVTKMEELESFVKSSVKSDAICDVEENEKVINSVEHEVYFISDENSDIETNTKVKQEDKKVKPEVKHSLKNEDCVRNGNISESEKELNLSSGKVDKVYNVEENKKMKRKLKKRKAKAIKPIEKKNSADKDEVCISQLIKKVTKMEELESFVKSSVKSDAICDVEENEKVINSVEHEVYIISDETSDFETNTKVKQEDKKVKPELKHSLKNEDCVRNGNVSESEKELNLSSGKVDKVCNVEENKKMKRKLKKRKAKAIKPIEKKNSADKDEVCISQLIKKVAEMEELESSVKIDETHDVNNSVEHKNYKKINKKRKKTQSNVKESVDIKESVKGDEAYNLDLTETSQKSEKQRTSVKSDERCYLKVNGKESSVFNEVSNGKSEKKKKRKRKSKKKKSKVNFDEHQAIDTESVYVKEHSNLDSSDKDVLLAEMKEKNAITTDNFSKSSEDTVVVKYDRIKTVDSFPVMMNESSYFNEVVELKTAKEEQEKSKSKLSSTVESPYENNNSICKLSAPKSICVEGKVKLNSVDQDRQKSNSSRSSSIDHFHSHINSIFDLYPKSVCNNENVQFNYFDQSIKTLKESVSSTKTEELPDRNFHVPSQQSTSHLALPDTRTDLPCEDLSKATPSSEIKKKKKPFQKLRKWLTDLCCCMRKDNE